MDKKLKQGTLCVQAGYKAKNGEPIELPIIQSTTFKYDDSDEMAKLFDLGEGGLFLYSPSEPHQRCCGSKDSHSRRRCGCCAHIERSGSQLLCHL